MTLSACTPFQNYSGQSSEEQSSGGQTSASQNSLALDTEPLDTERGAPGRGAPERGAPERGAPERSLLIDKSNSANNVPGYGVPEYGEPRKSADAGSSEDMRLELQRQAAKAPGHGSGSAHPGDFALYIQKVTSTTSSRPLKRSILSVVRVGSGPRLVVALAGGEVGLVTESQKEYLPLAAFQMDVEKVVLDGERGLAAGWRGSSIEIVDLIEGATLGTLENLGTRATSVQFQSGNDALFLGGADGRVYRWKYTESGKRSAIERYIGPASIVSSVAAHPGGRVFFSGDWAGGLNAWLPYDQDAFKGVYDRNAFLSGLFSEKVTRQNAGRSDATGITQLLPTSDGQGLVVVLQDGRLEWWMLRGLMKIGEVQAHKGLIYDASLSADGKLIATVGRDGFARAFLMEFDDGMPPAVAFTERWHAEMEGKGTHGNGHVVVAAPEEVAIANSGKSRLLSYRFESETVQPENEKTPLGASESSEVNEEV